jgi:hypothetical protein
MPICEVVVTLCRDGTHVPFGFKLRGGRDLKEPFVIQRVATGSPADGELRRGDVVNRISGQPAAELTHQKAHDMIKNAGSSITLVVTRDERDPKPHLPPLPVGPEAAPPPQQVSTPSREAPARHISDIMTSPLESLPVTVFPGSELARQQEMFAGGDRERIVVTNQPYRTTPLVLPGAKVKRDTAPATQSYLALQSNPLLWTATPGNALVSQQSAGDALLKQKLEGAAAVVQRNLAITAAAEGPPPEALEGQPRHEQQVVHKQFNSPLGLYSKENVEEVMHLQSGLIPPNPPRALDLKNSETFRALMEEDKGPNARIKEYRPVPVKVLPSNPPFKVNTLGLPHEKIQQSYSFKRLMADVLGETDF